MKKIIITENQLKKIAELLITEQSDNINIEGRNGVINPDGTISLLNKIGKQIKIRLKTDRLGDVNIVKFIKNDDGDYEIKTKKGRNEIFNIKKVKSLINFIDSSESVSSALDSSLLVGDLKAHKVSN